MSGRIDLGVGAGAANGQPHHQPVEDTAGLIPGTDQLRSTMRERILEYVRSKPSLAEWLPRLLELEEILYTKFPNKNDYYNMMKGPVEPQVQFVIMTLSAQNQQNPQMSGQAAQMTQVSGSGVAVGVGGADGLLQHQWIQDTAAMPGGDQQFVMLRTALREKIFEYIGRKQSSAEWRKRLPELAKRLEEILYRKFPNKNDYFNMMKGPVEPQLQFAIKTLSAQNQHNQQNPQMTRQIASSSGYGTMIPTPGTMIPTPGTMIPTPGMTQVTSASSRIPYVTDNNALSSSGGGMIPQNTNMGASMQGPMSNGYQHLNTNIPQNSTTNNVQSTMVLQKVKNPPRVSEGQIHKKLRCRFCKKIGHCKKDCLRRKKWFEKKGIPYDPTHKQT